MGSSVIGGLAPLGLSVTCSRRRRGGRAQVTQGTNTQVFCASGRCWAWEERGWGCAVSGDSVRGLVTREDLDTVEKALEGPAGVRLGAPLSVRAVRAGVEASRAVGVGGTGAQGKGLVGQGQSSAQKCPARGGHPREPGHRERPRWLTGDVAEPWGWTWPVMDDRRDTSLRWGWEWSQGSAVGRGLAPGTGEGEPGVWDSLLPCWTAEGACLCAWMCVAGCLLSRQSSGLDRQLTQAALEGPVC